jgi:predicted nucleotidyltransferase
MTLNSDYKDILSALSAEKVKFLLVGAYALAVHGYPRATLDIDLWIWPDSGNATAVLRALTRFGAPLDNLSIEDFKTEDLVLQIGVAPRRIAIITSLDGLNFNEAFDHAKTVKIEDITVHVLSIEDMIINKRATGRTKDLADAEMLEERHRQGDLNCLG